MKYALIPAACLAAALAIGCAAARATPPLDASQSAGRIAPPADAKPEPFGVELRGSMAQGGMAVGRTLPNAAITLDDVTLKADAAGQFVIGFDRDQGPAETLRITAPDGASIERMLTIEPRAFLQTRVDGLPPAMVTPPAEALTRIKQDAARKAQGFASLAPGASFAQAFIWPVKGRISSPWGAARVLNGEVQRPHYGVDVAAPIGTPVSAPADGVIAFAEPELYYEGGLIMIDHGQGLLSLYLHLSELDVAPGQKVKQGQLIGRVGAKGRATGPHLCWRMKWRGRNLDPSLAVVAAGGPAAPAPISE